MHDGLYEQHPFDHQAGQVYLLERIANEMERQGHAITCPGGSVSPARGHAPRPVAREYPLVGLDDYLSRR